MPRSRRREPARVSIATSESTRAAELLHDLGVAVEHYGGRLVVGCTGERIPEINALLVHGGMPIHEITPQRLSLEQLYFRLTAAEVR